VTNPIDDIENKQGNTDFGRMVAQVYLGAKQEASFIDAFWSTVAWVIGLMKSNEGKDETTS